MTWIAQSNSWPQRTMSRAIWICLHGIPRGGVTGSVRARTPSVEQVSEVRAVNTPVTIDVSTRQCWVRRSPGREQRTEVCAVDFVVDDQICKALASVRNRVVVVVGRTGSDFTRVADAVVIAVGLATVGDEWTIIASVTARVAVGVQLIAICDEWTIIAGVAARVAVGVQLIAIGDVDAVVVAVGATVQVSVDGAL